jgi:hypothetical protein
MNIIGHMKRGIKSDDVRDVGGFAGSPGLELNRPPVVGAGVAVVVALGALPKRLPEGAAVVEGVEPKRPLVAVVPAVVVLFPNKLVPGIVVAGAANGAVGVEDAPNIPPTGAAGPVAALPPNRDVPAGVGAVFEVFPLPKRPPVVFVADDAPPNALKAPVPEGLA